MYVERSHMRHSRENCSRVTAAMYDERSLEKKTPNNALLTDAFSSLRCACSAAIRGR